MLKVTLTLLFLVLVTITTYIGTSPKKLDQLSYNFDQHQEWQAEDLMAAPHIAIDKNKKELESFLSGLAAQAFQLEKNIARNDVDLARTKGKLHHLIDRVKELAQKREKILALMGSVSPSEQLQLAKNLKTIEEEIALLDVQSDVFKKTIKDTTIIKDKNLDYLATNKINKAATSLKIEQVNSVQALSEAYKYAKNASEKDLSKSITDAIVETEAISRFIDKSLNEQHALFQAESLPLKMPEDVSGSLKKLLDPNYLEKALNPDTSFLSEYEFKTTDIEDLNQDDQGQFNTLELINPELESESVLLLDEVGQ